MLGRRPHPAHAKQMAMARRAAAAARRRIDCSGTLQADAARHRQTTPSPPPCRPSSRSIYLSRPRHHASRPILISSSTRDRHFPPLLPLTARRLQVKNTQESPLKPHTNTMLDGHGGLGLAAHTRPSHRYDLRITLNLVTLSNVASPPGRLGLGAPRRVLCLTRKTIRRSMEHSGG